MRVSLFVTCLVDQLYPRVAWSSMRLLERFGVEVEFDQRQTCCGQPAFNSGFQDEARRVARHFLSVFENSEAIVAPSGSCCAMIKAFLPQLFDEDSTLGRTAREIAGRTYELSEFLVSVLGIESTGARFPESVTYHDSCHLLRELKISEQPRVLIRNIKGIDFRELDDRRSCCGFGGTFSVKFDAVSAAIGADKLESIRRSGARFVVANDMGCLMQLEGLLRRREESIQTLHLAELLAKFDD